MKNKDKMFCEKSYLERVRDCYKKGGVLFMFYDYLNKITRKNGKENQKNIKQSMKC